MTDQLLRPQSLIIVDLSFDPSYAEIVVERFGERVIGLKITSTGDGIDNWEERQLKRGRILRLQGQAGPICSIYCSVKCTNETVRILDGANRFALMSS